MQILVTQKGAIHNVLRRFQWGKSDDIEEIDLGAFIYYLRVFWSFLEPPTLLRKDIFIT